MPFRNVLALWLLVLTVNRNCVARQHGPSEPACKNRSKCRLIELASTSKSRAHGEGWNGSRAKARHALRAGGHMRSLTQSGTRENKAASALDVMDLFDRGFQSVQMDTDQRYDFEGPEVLSLKPFQNFTMMCNQATVVFQGPLPVIKLGMNSTLTFIDCNVILPSIASDFTSDPEATMPLNEGPIIGPAGPLLGNQTQLGDAPKIPTSLGVTDPGNFSVMVYQGGTIEASCQDVATFNTLTTIVRTTTRSNQSVGLAFLRVDVESLHIEADGVITEMILRNVVTPIARPRSVVALLSGERFTGLYHKNTRLFCKYEITPPTPIDSPVPHEGHVGEGADRAEDGGLKDGIIGIIAGGSVTALFCCCLVSICMWYKKRKKKKKHTESPKSVDSDMVGIANFSQKPPQSGSPRSSNGAIPLQMNTGSQSHLTSHTSIASSGNHSTGESSRQHHSRSTSQTSYDIMWAGSEQGDSSPIGPSIDDRISRASKQLQKELQGELLEIHGAVGEGGFGTVYKGLWRKLPVAVKTVMFQDNKKSNRANSIIKEAAIAYNLQHPNIVTTYAHEIKPFGDSDGLEHQAWKLYLVQEYCDGGTVRSLVDSGGFLPFGLARASLDECVVSGERWARIYTVMEAIAQGLTYVHSKNIAHGDLNPSNVMFRVNGTSSPDVAAKSLTRGDATVKITDFGMSIHLSDVMSHQSNIRHGTPFYAAPEIAAHHHLHKGSDVYSYGVMLWELMAGCAPYQLQRLPDRQKARFLRHPEYLKFTEVTPLSYTLLAKACLSKNPRHRPTFAQIVVVLKDVNAEILRGSYMNTVGVLEASSTLDLDPFKDLPSRCPPINEDSQASPTWLYLRAQDHFNTCLASEAGHDQDEGQGLPVVTEESYYECMWTDSSMSLPIDPGIS